MSCIFQLFEIERTSKFARLYLLYGISCYSGDSHNIKSYDHMCNTLWPAHVMSMTASLSTTGCLIEIMFILKAKKINFQES